MKTAGVTLLLFMAMCLFAWSAVRLADEPFWVEPSWHTFQVPGGELWCNGRSQHLERYDIEAQCIFDPYGHGTERSTTR